MAWPKLYSRRSCSRKFALTNGLVQVVNGPTYGIDSKQPSQLDLAFVNAPGLVNDVQILAPIADHCPNLIQLSFTSQRGKSLTTKPGITILLIFLGCVITCLTLTGIFYLPVLM